MKNIQTDSQRRFIEDVAQLFIPWGVPQTAARLYGFLLLSAEPASLDHIVAGLGVSKSGASVAARLLEKYMLVRRHAEPGSKRVLYEASDNYEGMLTEQNRMIETLSRLLRAGAKTAAPSPARQRLEQMAQFYTVVREGMDAALTRWRAETGL